MDKPQSRIDASDAASRFEALLEQVAAGQEVVFTVDGQPVARLVPYQPVTRPLSRRPPPGTWKPRVPGGWEGRVWIADDFDELPDHLLDEWYNGEVFPPDEQAPPALEH